MWLNFKTVTKEIFKLEAEQSWTIKNLKVVIEKDQGAMFPADCQKLIYVGKVMDDAATIESYDIDPQNFIVCLVQNRLPKISSQPLTSSGSFTIDPTDSISDLTPITPDFEDVGYGNLFPTSEGDEQIILDMMNLGLGFEYQQVVEALQVSSNNPDIAMDYLLDKLPEPSSPVPRTSSPVGGNSSGTEGQLGQLRALPQFQQIQRTIQNNPSLFPEILRSLSHSNPELVEAISSNQEEFLQLVNMPIELEERDHVDGTSISTIGRFVLGLDDRPTIDRLMELGFSQPQAVQAYFACNKNEQLAANFLLSDNFEEDLS